MKIWTTPQIQDLLSISREGATIAPAHEIKGLFLERADRGDIIILAADGEQAAFLQNARKCEKEGPFLFIASDSMRFDTDLRHHNAVVLDAKKLGPAAVKSLVDMMMRLADRQYCIPPLLPVSATKETKAEQKTVDEAPAIAERLRYIQKNELPVTMAIEVREHDEQVVARGLCSMKETAQDRIVLHRMKQPALLKGAKKEAFLRLYFSHKHEDFGCVVKALQISDKELVTTVPTQLFTTRDMRIQPNSTKPVHLYVLVPNEPTTRLRLSDISTRGIGFTLTRDLPLDATYAMTILLPDPAAVIMTTGIIRFKKEERNGGIRYGAEIRPHPWDEDNISKYLMKRDGEIINHLRNMQ